ncbi:MAG: insulinase family protein [Verrucomicrobia bacterium]|nr:insulinase family protein [Verrucomicrobiota bacterium]
MQTRPTVLPLLAPLLALALPAFAADIPDRPEKLTYPQLNYSPPDAKQFRVALKAGPVAYVVPDRELPLVNISILVRTGDYLDPVGKEGLAGITGYMLARGGTASKKAEDLEERLAFLAANLNSSVGDTQGSVGMNLLSKDLDEGFAILREVLTAPRFQDDKLTLRKQQSLQAMKQRNDDAADIEQRERRFLAYGDGFYFNRHSTQASLESITRADLEAFHKRWFHPKNFVIAVNGDFDRDAMVARLEKLFAAWPFTGEVPPPIPTERQFAKPGVYLVDKEVNQGRVTILLPGIRRDDPDYQAAQVMNDILGGGGFTSRIMNRVRSDEGLAYSAGSGFPGGVYHPMSFLAAFQSKSRTVAYATSIVLEEMKKVASEQVTDEELTTTKNQFIETFPRTFATKGSTAGAFASDEFTGRFAKDPDFWKNYRSKVNAVTKADVQRVAKKFLTPEKVVILVVGTKEEILKGHPDHPVKLESLGGGRLVDQPLRDPLTMKPAAK